MKPITFVALLCAPVCMHAQITVRWDATPSQRSISCPSSSATGSLRIRVTNLNDIIYAHAVETSVAATPVHPPVPTGFNTGADATLTNADSAVNLLMTKYAVGFIPELKAGKYANLSRDVTLGAWAQVIASPEWAKIDESRKNVEAITPVDNIATQLKEKILKNIAKLKAAEEAVAEAQKRGHSLETQVSVDYAAKNVVKARITQSFGGSPVENGEQEFTCTIDQGAFTLSLGPIFSQLQSRQYVSVAIPNSAGTGTSNVLAVQNGSGYRAAGAALVNFALPRASKGGFALFATTGPTFKSAADNTSAFGWFAGVSIALNKLLYLTPGFHYGEFADFPRGYADGTPIPTGVATPTPLKRYTWRFGFGISFRTASFAKTEEKKADDKAQPAAAPADKKSESSAPVTPAAAGGAADGVPPGLPAGGGKPPPTKPASGSAQ